MAWSRLLVAACALLAVPTALDPATGWAAVSYLLALTLVVAALCWGTAHLRAAERRPWLLFAAAAGCWLAGDLAQRVPRVGTLLVGGVGPADVCWLASYPLLVAAVGALMRARGLPRELVREIRLDVLVVTAAAGVVAWHLIVTPQLAGGDPVPTVVVNTLYPLGDVVIFGLALALVMAPGRRGPAAHLLIACLGLSLPADLLMSLLPQAAPGFDSDRLDALLLLINALLGAAALHPGRAELTRAVRTGEHQVMDRWRVLLLGSSLCTVALAAAVSGNGTDRLPAVAAGVVISLTVLLRFYRVVRDREAAEAELVHQARHDQLTGAANRALLMERLSATVRRGASDGYDVVLIFLDLDGFKRVNDTWGHPVGDEVLRTVTRRISALVRPVDTVARVGGDEFVVLCYGLGEEHAVALGTRLREAVRQPIELGPALLQVGASVGVLSAVAASCDGADECLRAADEMLRRADSAMYEAKRVGGGVRAARPTLGPASLTAS